MKIFRRNAPRSGTLEVRRASLDELDPIVDMLEELVTATVPRRKRAKYLAAVRQDQARRLEDPDTAWLVAHRAGELVGCARADLRRDHPLLAYLDDPGYGYLFGVFVKDGERGRGTGARLVKACEAWLKSRGARWAVLHSAPEALGFYRAEGYEPSFEFAKRL